jgi:hypothetical protein
MRAGARLQQITMGLDNLKNTCADRPEAGNTNSYM